MTDFDRLMDALLDFETTYYEYLADNKPVEDEIQLMINPLLVLFSELFITYRAPELTSLGRRAENEQIAGGDV